MPIVTPSSDASGAFETVHSPGGMAQVLYPAAQFPNPLPATIAPSGSCMALWARGFLTRRHKVPSRGTRRFSDPVVFGKLGVLRLRRMHIGAPPTAAR
jgi:hypothetical protein